VKSTIYRDPAGTGRKSIPFLRLSAFAVGAMLVSGIAAAAAVNMSDAQARYRQERANCMSGQSHQDRATCLQEAGAALQEAKRGLLDDGQSAYEQNRRMRCEVHQAGDRDDCLRRMRGEGTITGSVEGGGIYRELRTTVPAQ
jgi:hypothetical protein